MRNPLNKRLPRELKGEFSKYLIIFLFFIITISLVSGFLVADNSLIAAYDESFDKYNIEDGNFEYAEEITSEAKDTIEAEGLTVYNNYYKEFDTEDYTSNLRIFGERHEVDKLCLLTGELPSADGEIAIDRLYGENHKLEIGDTIKIKDTELTVCGTVAFSDYSTLFSDNSDLMFDNDKFGIGTVTDEYYKKLSDVHEHYVYSWVYDDKPSDDKAAKDRADDLMKVLAANGPLTNFIPEYSNQAIIFTGNDFGGDKNSIIVFLYALIIILAFVFSITISNTINKEACVIGTLRASGYSKGEMVRHYMIVPMVVLLVAALIGNVLGYTVFQEFFANLYLHSYSLPTYKVLWTPNAFVLTTVIPFLIMLFINFIMLSSKMRISPLRFIRRDIGKKTKKKAFKLNTKINIMTRFRLRVIFQNIPNYITIFVGIFFAEFIILFGLVFSPMLDNFKDEIVDSMFSKYQYVLKAPAETENIKAEKAALTSLETYKSKFKQEDVTIYGVEPDSRFIKLASHGDKVTISTAYNHKFGYEVGDVITLQEKYTEKKYKFTVGGFFDYPSTIAIFMDREQFNKVFDNDADYYNMYMSNSEISDIDEKLIASTITEDDLTKTSRQLTRSMGDMMMIFVVFGVIVFVLIIYLLAKIIIEKNAQSISMTKILGYNNREINRLYIHTTSIITVLSLLICLPIMNLILEKVFVFVFSAYPGWLEYSCPPITMVKVLSLGIISYFVVAFVLTRKTKKIPLDEALKNVE